MIRELIINSDLKTRRKLSEVGSEVQSMQLLFYQKVGLLAHRTLCGYLLVQCQVYLLVGIKMRSSTLKHLKTVTYYIVYDSPVASLTFRTGPDTCNHRKRISSVRRWSEVIFIAIIDDDSSSIIVNNIILLLQYILPLRLLMMERPR